MAESDERKRSIPPVFCAVVYRFRWLLLRGVPIPQKKDESRVDGSSKRNAPVTKGWFRCIASQNRYQVMLVTMGMRAWGFVETIFRDRRWISEGDKGEVRMVWIS